MDIKFNKQNKKPDKALDTQTSSVSDANDSGANDKALKVGEPKRSDQDQGIASHEARDIDRTQSADRIASSANKGRDQSTQASAEATEHGGPKGLEPTRYGDWERKGRCIDF